MEDDVCACTTRWKKVFEVRILIPSRFDSDMNSSILYNDHYLIRDINVLVILLELRLRISLILMGMLCTPTTLIKLQIPPRRPPT